MCTFAHGYVCFLVNCKDNQKRADTNTSASPNLLMGLQCLADSNRKIFVCLWLGGGRYDMKDGVSRIALKLSPDRNIEVREQFSAVTPAYHWNKTHWSDIYYEEMDKAIVKGVIKESYQLIVSKLPKAIRSKYLSECVDLVFSM